MSDRDLRGLERELDAHRESVPARHELTAALIRSGRGHLVWWAASERPHASAVRVRLEQEIESLHGSRATVGRSGWACAVSSVGDLMELSSAYRTATLMDVATGRWARLTGHPAAGPQLGARVESATVDALGRSRDVRGERIRGEEWWNLPAQAPNYDHLEHGPTPGPHARWRSEPLYDTDVYGAGASEVQLFQNYAQFSRYLANGRISKVWGLDTNMWGQGLPQCHYAQVLGVSLAFLGGGHEPIKCPAVRGSLTFRLVHTDVMVVPVDQVLEEVPEWTADVALPHQPPPIYPLAWPVQLQPAQMFTVVLRLENVAEDMLVRATLHSLVAKGVVG